MKKLLYGIALCLASFSAVSAENSHSYYLGGEGPYLLIGFFVRGNISPMSAEFSSRDTCEKARAQILNIERFKRLDSVAELMCVKK